jgi:hypothetical protein
MRAFITPLLLLAVLSGCKGPKILSESTNTLQEIKVTERTFELKTEHLTAVDTTDLERLRTGQPVTRKDKKTGIKITTQITEDKKLITQVEVPPIRKTVILADTTKVIIKERKVVQEERYNLWDKLNDLINLFVWIFFIFLLILLFIKFIPKVL